MADLFGSILSYLGTQDTNQANADIAQANNAWSAQQFATRYQTTTKDMQAAGLNPMLAYSQGGGSPPTAQSYQAQNPMSSAVEAYHQSAQRDVMAEQIQNMKEQNKNIQADTHVKDEQAKLIASQKLAADADERLKTTAANKQTHDLFTQQNVTNPTQKALAASYWSQIDVNKANLPKIASEIVSNGANAHLARARANQAIAEEKITSADLQRALNEQAMERGVFGKVKPYLNSAGKIKDLLPSKSTGKSTTEEHTDIIRDEKGQHVGSSRYRTTR
jgi:hypothetical protein